MPIQTANNYGPSIAVLTNGFVFYTDTLMMNKYTGMWDATHARCIRRWGTDEGLGQLVDGPRDETILDAEVPSMNINTEALLFVIPCARSWR